MKLKELYSTSTIIVICAIIATIQAASAVPTISVEPSFQTVSSGENFTVNIYVDPEGNVTGGVAYVLYFNNTLLSATSLVSGTFFSGYSVNTYGEGINNSTGTIDYGEATQGGGVTTPGTLTTITFQAIADHGTSELRFDEIWTELSDPDSYPITTNISDGSVKITMASTPFLICGYVFNDGGSDCNDPTVNITNLNTSEECTAKTNVTSNYYQTMLSSCADVVAGEILCFNVTSPDGSSNITEHTVTQAEVGGGGFELNITLEPFTPIVTPTITSCDEFGNIKDAFAPGGAVYVNGSGFSPNTNYTLWIQNDPVNDSDTLNASEDPSVSQETVTTEADGSFGPEEIWSDIPAGSPMNYDIVVDNQDGVYNAADDGIDSATTSGITAPIPELPGVVLVSIGLLGLAGLVWRRKDE